MRIAIFCHSLLSDWNHGNAHFLRGVAAELIGRGHQVVTYEPKGAWSAENLGKEQGERELYRARVAYPWLSPLRYDLADIDLEAALDGVDLCLVHEWSDHDLVRRLGALRMRSASFRLLFHDTHHRMVSDPSSMAAYDLEAYDGVLAFGSALRELYIRRGLVARAYTWHEAADTRVFYPREQPPRSEMRDLVFIGNWGDGERTRELFEFLVGPAKAADVRGAVYGVRYPEEAQRELEDAGLSYRGWAPNYEVPEIFARSRLTVHIPRRPYASALPGIPTIRPFEALACGIPLVSAPWDDRDGLFTPGRDFLVAENGQRMTEHLRTLLGDPEMAEEMAAAGRRTILARHTCAHRVDELFAICRELGIDFRPALPKRTEHERGARP